MQLLHKHSRKYFNDALKEEIAATRFYVGIKFQGDNLLNIDGDILGKMSSIVSELSTGYPYVKLSGDYQLYSTNGYNDDYFICQHN